MNRLLFLPVPLLVVLIHVTSAARILVVVPTASISHQKPVHILTKALLQRGHEITFFTTDPITTFHENLTQIDLSASYKLVRQMDFVAMAEMSPLETFTKMVALGYDAVNSQLISSADNHIKMLKGKKFLAYYFSAHNGVDYNYDIWKNHTFDLVIFERLGYQGYYGLFHKVGSPPQVGIVTMSALAPTYTAMGNAMNPAYLPDVWVGFSDHMTFWERMYNTVFYLWTHYLWYYEMLPQQENIMRKYFGTDPPSVFETDRNYSLFIINNHFSAEYPRPNLPSIVEITGIHVSTNVEPLPKAVQEFLDGAEHGIIYFSLGSNVLSNALPLEKIQAFVEAFRQVPQRVLWKWENDSLPSQPENLMVSKWLPQQAVLAHPKVRLFITQGGLQSMNEAMYHAVPFLVIPFIVDQPHTAAKVAQAEIGVRMEFRDVTKDTLLSNIRTVLEDPKYNENMKRLSAVFREHKADSIERAVWWVEYVIRHKGAKHLRSAALDLHWWQLLLLDVIAFVMAVAALTIYVIYFVTRRIISLLKGKNQKEKKQ